MLFKEGLTFELETAREQRIVRFQRSRETGAGKGTAVESNILILQMHGMALFFLLIGEKSL